MFNIDYKYSEVYMLGVDENKLLLMYLIYKKQKRKYIPREVWNYIGDKFIM